MGSERKEKLKPYCIQKQGNRAVKQMNLKGQFLISEFRRTQ